MPNEMIERVAQAIRREYFDFTKAPDWNEVARAAITAMREPTDDMLFAAEEHTNGNVNNIRAKSLFICMINEALNETKTTEEK